MSVILYEGKSKVVFKGIDDATRLIKYKDTATAFNGEKKAELSGKGRLNAAISHLIFGYLEENGIKTHFIKAIGEDSALVKRADIIPIEVVVRNAAAGGFSKKYGIAEGAALKNTVVEFSLKSDELSDPMMNESQITALSLAAAEELAEMTKRALNINRLLFSLFDRAGIRLIDFKLEFGVCGGELILCDEISPDSCRLWDKETEEKLDKDRFRRDLGGVTDSYNEVLRRLRDVRQV